MAWLAIGSAGIRLFSRVWCRVQTGRLATTASRPLAFVPASSLDIIALVAEPASTSAVYFTASRKAPPFLQAVGPTEVDSTHREMMADDVTSASLEWADLPSTARVQFRRRTAPLTGHKV